MEKALIVVVTLSRRVSSGVLDAAMCELRQLVESTGTAVEGEIAAKCENPQAKLLIGTGKALEIANIAKAEKVDCVIFDENLTSSQQRNLEDLIGIKTIDRTQLILDIFAKRARSSEGKVQVELAQLEYLMPRLSGKGIILSRLGGGIGTRGPGEQKLEVDRRRIRKRISGLKEELKKLGQRRERLRSRRKSLELSSIALVGYTNAGKSTLLNRLTDSGTLVANRLFSTLDPIARRFVLNDGQTVLFLDTVGFLDRLPHYLVEAFHATLEEVIEADILVHVLNAASPDIDLHNDAVKNVLKELEVEDKKVVTVLNKVDLVEDECLLARLQKEFNADALISAKTGNGIDSLIEAITGALKEGICQVEALVPQSRMDILNKLYDLGKVFERDDLDDSIRVRAIIKKRFVGYFKDIIPEFTVME